MLKKNDFIEMKIDDIGSHGEGIGRHESFVVFVKNALPGDYIRAHILKVKKSMAFAKIDEILESSSSRQDASCIHAKTCGGCQLQFLKYDAELSWKENDIREKISRISKIDNFHVETIIASDNLKAYRNKGQFPLSFKNGELKIGLYAYQSHNVVDIVACDCQKEIASTLILEMKKFIEKYKISVYDEEQHKGLLRHIIVRTSYATNDVSLCLVINDSNFKHKNELIDMLKDFKDIKTIDININKNKGNVVLGKKTINIFGKGYITDFIGDLEFSISPTSFFQTNPVQMKKMYAVILKYANLSGDEIVLDLYCGIGTISLYMARFCKKVIAVEYLEQAVKDANENARLNEIENSTFISGDVLKVLREENIENIDVLVLDPPKKGCDEEVLHEIVKMKPRKIIYVSCNPATFARDVKVLVESFYKLSFVQPIDMFPNTINTELVALLESE